MQLIAARLQRALIVVEKRELLLKDRRIQLHGKLNPPHSDARH
jgi:hypothetical protein